MSPTECHLSPVAMVSAVLTPSEMQVANLLLEARGDREIACAIGISENAVKERLRGMCRKARIPNDRVQLAILLLGYTPRRADLKPTRRQRARILFSFRRPGRPDPLMRQKLERVIERSRQGWSWARMSPEIFPHQKRPKICAAQTCKFAHSHRAELEAAGAVFPDTRRAQARAQKLERMIELALQGWSWVRMGSELYPDTKHAWTRSVNTRKFARDHRAELEEAGVHVALRALPTKHPQKPPAAQPAISHPVASLLGLQ